MTPLGFGTYPSAQQTDWFCRISADSEQSASIHKGWPPLGIGTARAQATKRRPQAETGRGAANRFDPFQFNLAPPHEQRPKVPKLTYTVRRTQ
jgi:hypothetical protein